MMNVLIWLVFGALAGLIASRLIRSVPTGTPLVTVPAGIMGALASGVAFLIFDTAPLSALNVRGAVVALAGAIITIALAHFAVRQPQ
jgi:uncharacterized membrane protein YeaQ/YmgE (transglycosylase-associated protein family)